MGVLNRLLNALRPERHSRELDRELAFHIEERVDQLMANGLSEPDARREAARRFGDPLRQKERTRDMDVLRWLESVLADLRYALRTLRSSPGFTVVAIASLAIGIGANTAIFSLMDAVVLRSLPVERPAELVRITMGDDDDVWWTNPIWESLREHRTGFSGLFAYSEERFNLARGGEERRVAGDLVSGDYFATLGVRAAAGRLITRADDVRGCAAVAVLSHGFWRSEFGGDPSIVGSTIHLDDVPHTVVGVAEPGFAGLTVGRAVQVHAPLCAAALRGRNLDARSNWFLRILGRRAPDTTLEQLRGRLAAASPAVFDATVPAHWTAEEQAEYRRRVLRAEPAPAGQSRVRAQFQQPLVVLMVVVGVVLLIACVNVANLLMARSAARRRELAIRMAIGAGRARVMRQLLTESVLLAALAAGVGTAFAAWGSRLLVRMISTTQNAIWLDLSMNGRVLAFTVLTAALTGILFGLAPAWGSARMGPFGSLKAAGRGIAEGHSRFNAGKLMVAAQVALSLTLLAGASLLLASFHRLANVDPGFEADGVLLAQVGLRSAGIPEGQRAATHDLLLERLRSVPPVRSAAAAQTTPIVGSRFTEYVAVDGFHPPSEEDALVHFNTVTDDYFATLGTALLAGRDFDRSDAPGSPQVALINQAMARKFFGGANPIGRAFRIRSHDDLSPPIQVIGLVEDAKYWELREESLPTAYLAAAQLEAGPFSRTYILRGAVDPLTLVEPVKQAVADVNPAVSLSFRTLEAQVSASITRERLLAMLSGFFGAVAVLLAVIGLYGTLSYSVERRRKEIGVRLALGAVPATVLRMVIGEAGAMVLAGMVVGAVAALAAGRLIATFLYGVTPTDPATLLGSIGLLAAVAIAASAIPAWRAAHTDVLLPLREE